MKAYNSYFRINGENEYKGEFFSLLYKNKALPLSIYIELYGLFFTWKNKYILRHTFFLVFLD